jgi:phenylacetate-CoA ligase
MRTKPGMRAKLARARRSLQLRLLARTTPYKLLGLGKRRLYLAYRHACETSAYQQLLQEHGVRMQDIRSGQEVLQRAPVLNKACTFGRFSIEELCAPGVLANLASVLTSSGRLGRNFAFGLDTRNRAARIVADIDLGLEFAFAIDQRRSLLINCLPMGVRFASNAACVAEVSVREDMASALATKFGPYFEQIILVTDPLFLKRLMDYGRDEHIDWGQFRVNVVIGEEATGERFRDYVAARLGADLDAHGAPLIGSSFGVGELGLNLFFETRESVRLHRAARRDAELARTLFGAAGTADTLPMLYAYDPLRSWVEVLDADANGYGALAVSTLSRDQPVPLLRYRTGDRARLIDAAAAAAACRKHGIAPPAEPFPWIAVTGRDTEQLPDGTHVLDYKDALYADHAIADACTGAFKLHPEPNGVRMQIQLRRGASAPADPAGLIAATGGRLRAEHIEWYAYEAFPYGMSLDYERKFDYFTAPARSA